ncbi:hypothetical protein M422DRAFT_46306 [Sphaerobolus stellatus SS14]|uniref:Biotrophy-associated secreted protein 2 n=1 Tax=Sphaerobolus stellatus (strain SS14) TaxID=990650 RepID=A0A0C9VG60_SPHS4|nr:hypothetical protein M422DRAFT_46306 [Sphaerobolus stellatus SS14]
MTISIVARITFIFLLLLNVTLSRSSVFVADQRTQFITGVCASDADCASGCYGFRSGNCAGAVIAQTRDGGCGFGDAQPNNRAAVALLGPSAPGPSAAASAVVPCSNNPAGTQFITGVCASDADCASGCCGFKSGKCAGAVIAQTRDGGCGFGDAQPNNRAAVALLGPSAPCPSAAAPSAVNNAAAAPGANGAGNNAGTQFTTALCVGDVDIPSGCCGFNSGKCTDAAIAQERDGGCGFGDSQSNANAAKNLVGRRYIKKEYLYGY